MYHLPWMFMIDDDFIVRLWADIDYILTYIRRKTIYYNYSSVELFREFFDGIDEEQSKAKSAANGANFNNLVGTAERACLGRIQSSINFRIISMLVNRHIRLVVISFCNMYNKMRVSSAVNDGSVVMVSREFEI